MRRLPLFNFLGPVLTPEECDRVIAMAEMTTLRPGTIEGPEKLNAGLRNSSITFLPPGGEAAWLYDKVIKTALQSNKEVWGFQLDAAEKIQIARYETDQHYVGHLDIGSDGPNALRKLSVVIQLSDPADYEGGDLIFYINSEKLMSAPRTRGEMILFPSYVLHQAKPVTSGRRYSLANWIIGREPFR